MLQTFSKSRVPAPAAARRAQGRRPAGEGRRAHAHAGPAGQFEIAEVAPVLRHDWPEAGAHLQGGLLPGAGRGGVPSPTALGRGVRLAGPRLQGGLLQAPARGAVPAEMEGAHDHAGRGVRGPVACQHAAVSPPEPSPGRRPAVGRTYPGTPLCPAEKGGEVKYGACHLSRNNA